MFRIVPSGLELWSVNHISMYENSELHIFKKKKRFLGEISSNWTYNLLEINVYKALESCS